jgi:hypothetical protein
MSGPRNLSFRLRALLAEEWNRPTSIFEDGSAVGSASFRLVVVMACLVTFGLSAEVSVSMEVQMAAFAKMGVGMLAALWSPKG